MATDAEYTELYTRLRASFLSRHFAINRHFRTNFFSENTYLEADLRADDFLKKTVDEKELLRWQRYRDTDNPLMAGGQFLTCLAVEDHLGHPHAERILHSALMTLKSLYKFGGNHFDGYINRWDPTTSDKWHLDNGQLQNSDEFLVNQSGNYIFNNSAQDPRHMPLRSRETLINLMGEEEADRYLKADGDHWEYFDRYRRWEASMDEIVGLVMGYFMIEKLSNSTSVKSEVRDQASSLGDYLAEHAFLLVRPAGGLNARGATGVLPALEYPLVRALLAITGNTYHSRTNFEGAMRKAGYWDSLAAPLAKWTVAGVAGILITPIITGLIVPLGVGAFIAGALPLAGVLIPATGIPAAIADIALPLISIPLARTYAIYVHRDCFDVKNDMEAREVAVAFFLMENLSPILRFQGWMWGSGFTGGEGGTYAGNFPPYLGLTALDDTDTTVRDAYLGWLSERHKHLDLEPKDEPRAEGCFASAIALLLSASPDEEIRLKTLLDERYAILTGQRATPDEPSDLPIVDRCKGGCLTIEAKQPALDYMGGLALAWLYAKRRKDAGNPVTTEGFPQVPSNFAGWPVPSVPAHVLEEAKDKNVVLPVSAIQDIPIPHIDQDGAPLFDTFPSPQKSPIPSPVLPTRASTLFHDTTIFVREADGDFNTGIVLENGDEYEFEAGGKVYAGVLATGDNGPNGWEHVVEYDATFPLHGSLDPIHAHPFCLLGRLGGYFFIGEHRLRERFLYHRSCPLWLRINDQVPGNGSGWFRVRVRVWCVDFGSQVLADQPIAYYRFKDVTGAATAEDSSGNANHGAFSSSGITLEAPGRGNGDAAALFSTGRMVVPNSPILNPAHITLEAFINWSGNNGFQQRIIEKSRYIGGEESQYGLSILPDGKVMFEIQVDAVGSSFVSTLTVKSGQGHHLAATYDGSLMRIYFDGILEGEQAPTLSGVMPSNPTNLSIGNQVDRDRPFTGLIDEVALYDKALSSKRIMAHATACRKIIVATPQPQLGPPDNWVQIGSGRFETEDKADLVEYEIQLNAISSTLIEFRLESTNDKMWRKALVIPDGSGNRPEISIDPSQGRFSNALSLEAAEVNTSQVVELWKAKELGRNVHVLSVEKLKSLLPGSRVVFRWLND